MEASAALRVQGRLRRLVPGALLGMGAACMAAGIAVGGVAAQSPSPVVAALEAYSASSITFSVVPAFSAGPGAWVSIMNPNTGAVYAHSQISTTLTANQSATITVPATLPNGSQLTGFSSFLEIPGGTAQSVVLAAETTPITPLFVPPIPTTPSTNLKPPIPSVPPTSSTVTTPKGGSGSHLVKLPKTGAGPFLELAGVVLLVAGGLLLVLRPKPQ
jgi:hypothetical protein